LTLTTAGKFAALHILDTAANGSGTYSLTLNFSDGSMATVSGLAVTDWIQSSVGAITNLGRVDRSTGTLYPPTATLYEVNVAVPVADQSKTLPSLTFTVTSGANIAIFAVSTSVLGITAQPAAVTIDNGQSATLSVAASGGPQPYQYQWYTGPSGNTKAPITGATGSTLSVSPTSTTSYWVSVTDATNATVDSNTTTVTVNPALGIATQPGSATIDAGQSDILSVLPSGGTTPYGYQWYAGLSSNTKTPIGGATGTTLSVSPASTTSYWVAVTDATKATVDSNTATITVNPALVLGSQPASTSQPPLTANQTGAMVLGVVAGGRAPYAILDTTGLPGGLTVSLNGAVLVVSGTPNVSGTFPDVQIRISDANGGVATWSSSIIVTPDTTAVSAGIVLFGGENVTSAVNFSSSGSTATMSGGTAGSSTSMTPLSFTGSGRNVVQPLSHSSVPANNEATTSETATNSQTESPPLTSTAVSLSETAEQPSAENVSQVSHEGSADAVSRLMAASQASVNQKLMFIAAGPAALQAHGLGGLGVPAARAAGRSVAGLEDALLFGGELFKTRNPELLGDGAGGRSLPGPRRQTPQTAAADESNANLEALQFALVWLLMMTAGEVMVALTGRKTL
jgi:hypothetical protein